MFKLRTIVVVMAVCFIGLLAGTLRANIDKPQAYATRYGTEPDKWASAWLIRRHINPASAIEIYRSDGDRRVAAAQAANTILFDVPEADFKRTPSALTYQQLLSAHIESDPILASIGDMLFDIEQFSWTTAFSSDTEALEMSFRGIQQYFYPDAVPESCYYEFFDAVYEGLQKNSLQELHQWVAGLTGGWTLCAQLRPEENSTNVPAVEISELTRLVLTGRNIVFVDTREAREFDQRRIPGAINVPLRRIADVDIAALSKADLVIPYCIKDFRGYEVARRLRKAGLTNVALMQPHGLNGWIQHGLPTLGEGAVTVGMTTSLKNSICQTTTFCGDEG